MILITGGAGYIGSHVNKALHKKGYDTIVLDNLSHGHEYAVKWGEFIEGDLSDSDLLKSIFNSYDIQGVMHFAAFTSVSESIEFPVMYFKNNYKNTLNLFKNMEIANINKFIFSSTAALYGNPESIPITEKNKLNPINPYGKSKLMVEKILEQKSKEKSNDFNYISLRYFNASGADPDLEIGEDHNPETHLIPLTLDAAIGKREKIAIFGNDYNTPDGTCIRDYIHVCDLAQAHINAFEYLQENFENSDDIKENSVFNLGNGNGFSVKEVIDTCEKITKKEINKEIANRREGDPDILIADSKKAINVLNWKPKFNSLDKIVETAWKWHKKLNRNI
ncbi:MAG: UDP-glucose 4-epimerase GalE [Methanobrevibacter sp.]|jgi:UDP-glucose 4-epimerase|nr:UDP-glucose 4-epimerase GalE [Candidatus Methanoflexus mossambicus]